jgi:hypothetical protein
MTRAKKIEEAARAHIEKMRFVDCGLTMCEMTACAIIRALALPEEPPCPVCGHARHDGTGKECGAHCPCERAALPEEDAKGVEEAFDALRVLSAMGDDPTCCREDLAGYARTELSRLRDRSPASPPSVTPPRTLDACLGTLDDAGPPAPGRVVSVTPTDLPCARCGCQPGTHPLAPSETGEPGSVRRLGCPEWIPAPPPQESATCPECWGRRTAGLHPWNCGKPCPRCDGTGQRTP